MNETTLALICVAALFILAMAVVMSALILSGRISNEEYEGNLEKELEEAMKQRIL